MKIYIGYFSGEINGQHQTDILFCSKNLQKTMIYVENNIEEFIKECKEKVNWFQIDIYRTETKYLYSYHWRNNVWGIDEMEIKDE